MTATDTFRRGLKSQLGWYLVVGGVGFGVDAAAYLLLAHGLGWPLVPARLLAFLPATVVTWWINRRLTFARTGEAPGQRLWEYLRYLAVQGTGIAVNFAVFHGVASQYPDHDLAAFAAGSAVALAFNFAGARWLVFTGRQGGVAFPAVVAFGVLSVVLGQDANWDFANYHLYNAYAVIHGRLLTDFAAAGLQTYFNPLLDVPYYLMTVHLSAPVVAFVMGVAHGLVVPLAAAIGRQVMPAESNRTLWLLAGWAPTSSRNWAARWATTRPRRWCWLRCCSSCGTRCPREA
jgi:putative flippase GtrA